MTNETKLRGGSAVEGEPLPEGDEAPPAGARTMAIIRWALVALMGLLALAAWVHYAPERGEPHGKAVALYRCPMHPAVVQERPGSCSICGMDLVAANAAGTGGEVEHAKGEVWEAEHRHAAAASTAKAIGKYWCPMHPEVTSDDPDARCEKCGGMKLLPREVKGGEAAAVPPGLVPIDLAPDRRALMGMRTSKVVRKKLSGSLRVVGFVSADEQKVAVVTARAGGWIDRVLVAQSGERVKKGDVLVMLDSPELVTAQQTYLNNYRWKQNLAATPNATNPVAQAIDKDSLRRLRVYGMAQTDIEALEKRGEPADTVPIRSPISGWVARRSVIPGQFVAQGTELYQLADLSTVWVIGELVEQDAGRVAVGQKVRLDLAAYPGKRFEGRVDFVYPAVNPETRTLEARMVFKNPDLELRPGMYGDVQIEAGGAETLAAPSEAVVDTGDLQYVFVAKGRGRFEPRVVKVGARGGDHVEILSGLSAGDEVVTTANFFIDAESRLRAALDGHGAGETGGVTTR